MRITEVDNPVTQADIDQLEVFADRLFAKVGIDVEFTRHFLDRVNDERNIKQITMSELTRLFKQEYKRWGKPIAQLGPDAEAVMKDMATNINLPFALRWDHRNNELDLIAKTVMRKANFTTSNQEFAVEDGYRSMFRPNAYEVAAERLHSVLQRKEKENNAEGKPFRHALGWYASKIASGFRNIDTRELISYYQQNFDAVLSENYIAEEAAFKLEYDQLKIKIPANDNTKPIKGEVIDLNARRTAAKEALSKMSEADRKAANDFIKKNKTLLQRLSAVGARSAARHGIATVSSAVTGPAAPVVATVLNVTLLGWDLVDAGVAVWQWARSSNSKDIGQGNANREFGNKFALEIPAYPTRWPMDRTGTVLKRKQSEWMKEFGNTHLRNGKLNPSAGYQDAILRIAQAKVNAKNRASDNELIKKANDKPPVINFREIPPLEVPKLRPGKIITRPSKDREIDIEIPKRVKEPKKGDIFTEPKTPIEPTPTGPKVITKSPTQPKRTDKDPENPEVPDSKPSDQPDIEIPQPLNAPPLDIPFIPPVDVTKGLDPEIAFQDTPKPPVASTGGDGKKPPANNKNNNKQKKRKQKKDWGSGSDSEYTDPLQRWQRKYGMWDQ
jgi:hypothetical protein